MKRKNKKKIHILSINKEICEDPVLLRAMEILFIFANQAGLNNKQVKNLEFISNKNSINDSLSWFVCDMETKIKDEEEK